MTVILISSKAKEDLESLNNRIASSNVQAANQLLDKILDKFETLASFPNMGKSRNELIVGLRSFPVEDYLIFYFPLENGIEIARVVSRPKIHRKTIDSGTKKVYSFYNLIQ